MFFAKDYALAQACSTGNPAAWQTFLDRYTLLLESAAQAIVHDKLLARELADTLCADLFANPTRLLSYSGRGSLENWLRAALFQLYVNRYREQRRFVTFDEQACVLSFGFPPDISSNQHFEDCLRATLRELSPELRFLLASHFFDRATLAEIAQLLHVHESTVSRRLHRTLRQIRRGVGRKLKVQGLPQPAATSVSFDLHAELLFGVDMAKDRS